MSFSSSLTYPGRSAALPPPALISRIADTWRAGALDPTVTLLRATGGENPEKLFEAMHQERFRALQATTANTQRAYASDWRVFVRFCRAAGFAPLPASPAVLEAYIEWSLPYSPEVPYQYILPESQRRNVKVSTVERGLDAIGAVHRWLEYPNPARHPNVLHTWTVNSTGRSDKAPKAPVPYSAVERALPTYADSLKDQRAAAATTLQWSADVERSELIAITVEDLHFPPDREDGSVSIQRSRGDRAGKGPPRYVSAEARRRLETWLSASQITTGPIFRRLNRHGQLAQPRSEEPPKPMHTNLVALIWKDLARRAGYQPQEVVRISGHSPRIGVTHALLEAGASTAQIQLAAGAGSDRRVIEHSREFVMRGAIAHWFHTRANASRKLSS